MMSRGFVLRLELRLRPLSWMTPPPRGGGGDTLRSLVRASSASLCALSRPLLGDLLDPRRGVDVWKNGALAISWLMPTCAWPLLCCFWLIEDSDFGLWC
jgi:hypothetical protein